MQFFQSINGNFYPLSSIARVSFRKVKTTDDRPPDRVATVHTADGHTLDVYDYYADDFLNTPTHIWPSQPGTYIVTADGENDTDTFRDPVLGWAHTSGGDIYPVTIEGVNAVDGGPKDILLPDGKVVNGFGSTWDDLDSWRKDKALEKAEAAKAKG